MGLVLQHLVEIVVYHLLMEHLDPLQEDGFLVVEEEVHIAHHQFQVLVEQVVVMVVQLQDLLLILVEVVEDIVDLLLVLPLLETQE